MATRKTAAKRGGARAGARGGRAGTKPARAATAKKTARGGAARSASKAARKPSKRAPAAGGSAIDDVRARDIMHRDVITVSHATPLSEVEQVLTENRISGAPVVNAAGRIIGVVSIRDLVERYAEDPDSRPRRGAGYYQVPTREMYDVEEESFEVPAEAEETAGEVMTAEVYSVHQDAGLREIATRMREYRIHRILVLDDRHRCVGIISTYEILGAISG